MLDKGSKNDKHCRLCFMASNKSKMGFAHALRDIGVAAVNRGQLLTFGLLLIVCLIIGKMSSTAVDNDVAKALQYLRAGYFVGYLLFGVTLVGWIIHGRFLIRTSYQEQGRVAEERNRAQEKLGTKTGTTKS